MNVLDRFLDSIPEETRDDVRRFDAMVREEAPSLAPCDYSGMMGYGMTPYAYESGRTGEAPKIAIAARKHGISMYFLAVEDGTYVAEAAASTLGKVKVGKSCVRAMRLADVDEAALRDLIRRTANGTFGV